MVDVQKLVCYQLYFTYMCKDEEETNSRRLWWNKYLNKSRCEFDWFQNMCQNHILSDQVRKRVTPILILVWNFLQPVSLVLANVMNFIGTLWLPSTSIAMSQSSPSLDSVLLQSPRVSSITTQNGEFILLGDNNMSETSLGGFAAWAIPYTAFF